MAQPWVFERPGRLSSKNCYYGCGGDAWHEGNDLPIRTSGQDTDMATQIEHFYVVRDDRILGAEPIIKGTRTPVRAVGELWRLGYAPEEIPRELPHLTPASVFDALSYYSDHQQEINEYIERNKIPDVLVDHRAR